MLRNVYHCIIIHTHTYLGNELAIDSGGLAKQILIYAPWNLKGLLKVMFWKIVNSMGKM